MRKMKAISNWLIAIIVIIFLVAGIVLYFYVKNGFQGNTTTSGSQSNTSSSNSIDVTKVSASLILGGSTFINPQMQAWIQTFSSKYPNIQVTYQSVGSGAGVNNFIKGTYDVGATDVPMPSQLWRNATNARGSVITIPDIVGGVAVIYNLPGFDSTKYGNLNLTADILSGIYLGKIQYWDDPSIKAVNPNYNFPHQRIVPVHRSDGSGTTFVFTLWLYQSSQQWKSSGVGYGYTINWPVDSMGALAGKGSDGVTAYVKQTPYSIGYVEIQYAIANNLSPAAIKNPSGNFILPTPSSVSIALSSLNISLFPKPTQDWSNLTPLLLNSESPNAYPIVTFSYLVIQENYSDLNKAIALYVFLNYIFTQGQSQGNVINGYLPLPDNVRQFVLNEIKLITYNGQQVYKMINQT
jgi:phosphate transport system substrate-binding protein